MHCLHYPEGINGFKANLHRFIFGRYKENFQDFGDLDAIFKVKEGQRMLENMPFLYLISLMDGWSLTAPVEINHLEMEKN